MIKAINTLLFCLIGIVAFAQPSNDDCLTATAIPSTDNYCSGPMEFTNAGATPDPVTQQAIDDCVSIGFDNGVWFSFIPREPAVLVEVNSGGALGTIGRIKAVLYEGSCQTGLEYVECSPGQASALEMIVSDLTIGQRYYLYISSDEMFTGTFQLCLNDFIPPPSPESDCNNGVVLCDKSSFQVDGLSTAGDDDTELDGFPGACVTSEFQSAWYKWTCEDSGPLTFTLTPNDFQSGIESDDLDFAVFELPAGLDDCDNKEMLLCMASGQTGGCPFDTWGICNGPTGLAAGSTDVEEFPGCNRCNGGSDDNFIAPLQMVSGRSYALVVMNFNRSGKGFRIDFGGSGTFLGPKPNFQPEVTGDFLACEKEVMYTDDSESLTDPIVSWTWNFGSGADPQRESGKGPHMTEYESFGNKSVSLTVESSRGCLTTTILDIFVEPCCADTSTLVLNLDKTDPICVGDQGIIEMFTSGGAPEFNYSINGGPFTPNPLAQGLEPGEYQVDVVDIKGCESFDIIEIEEPEEVLADAGIDIEIDLGFLDTLDATAMPLGRDFTYAWNPSEGLDCPGSEIVDCPDPIVVAPGNTTYTVTVTDENGCTATDAIDVRVRIVRPYYAPTAILTDSTNPDDTFILGFGRQAAMVEELCIFDRWGNPIFRDSNIELDNNNEMVRGWNGRFGTELGREGPNRVMPGVYVWYAKVLFIDNVSLTYAGDVTVIR